MNKENKLKYNDPHSLLVVECNGRIKKIYTPFSAECKIDLLDMKKGDIISVTAVDEELRLGGKYQIRILIFITEGSRLEQQYFKLI